MSTEETATSGDPRAAELEALRSRLATLDQELAEHASKSNAALAAAQDRSYWLERWQLDLNALMQKRGASEMRVAFRAVRAVYRQIYNLRYQLRAVPLRIQSARRAVTEERAVAEAVGEDRFSRELSPDPLAASPATDHLHAQLEPADLDDIEQRLDPADEAHWEAAGETAQRRLALAFAAHYDVEPALSRSGLTAAMPPTDIHAMERASTESGGSTYYADLVADALAESGHVLQPGQAALDFGSSSGRVVRILAAAYPGLDWYGCDPNAAAIDWARSNLDGVEFTRSPESPPLSYQDAAFEVIFAISIWSHFSETAALAWLDEMHRLLRTGGRLVLTTHGVHSLAHASDRRLREPEQLDEIVWALYRHGFWFADEFGEERDHGVGGLAWGTAFLSPEWLLARTSGSWRVAAFHPGRVKENQDLYVLERV